MTEANEFDSEPRWFGRRCEDCGGGIKSPDSPFRWQKFTLIDNTEMTIQLEFPIMGVIFIDKYCEDCAKNHEDDLD